jgi:hypothetical protein
MNYSNLLLRFLLEDVSPELIEIKKAISRTYASIGAYPQRSKSRIHRTNYPSYRAVDSCCLTRALRRVSLPFFLLVNVRLSTPWNFAAARIEGNFLSVRSCRACSITASNSALIVIDLVQLWVV